MLGRILLYSVLTALGAKLLFRAKWREIGRGIDRVVNATLIAIVTVYSGWLVWWLFFTR